MNRREAILNRVREALSVKTDEHVRHGRPLKVLSREPDALSETRVPEFRRWLPAVDDDYESCKTLFAERCTMLKTDFLAVPNREAALAAIGQLAGRNRWSHVGYHFAELSVAAAGATGVEGLDVDRGYDVSRLEQCDAGITACDALIAQTGSVLITTRSAGGRALSVLPPHHVVLATRDQLVTDLPAAFNVRRQR